MYIEGIYLNTDVDSTFDNMMSSIADYTGSVKTESPKEFLKKLAEAVERSKIIMALGPLGGKNGLINIMSKGLGLPMAAVDWKAMGIAPIMDTLLPQGAVPLLSGDDELVGMILESGAQSIIVLSDNAQKRAEMLQTYIEPYIGAKSLEKPEEEAPLAAFASDGTDESVSDETPETVGEPSDSENEALADAQTAQPLYSGQNEEQTDGMKPLFADGTDENSAGSSQDSDPLDEIYYDDGQYQEPIYDDGQEVNLDEIFDSKASGDRVGFIEEDQFVLEDEPKKVKKPKKSKKFLLPVIAIVLVIAIVGGYFGYTGYYMPNKCREDYAALRQYKDDMGDGNLPEDVEIAQYGKLYQINSDMIGWLSIDGTNIDYPVVSAYEKGGKYYENHTFSGVYGSYGTPYFSEQYGIHVNYPRNLAVFGNNTGDGYMFSDLEKYLDIEFYKKHPVITMNSILYDDSWKIVSIMLMDKSLTTAAVNYTYSYSEENEIDKDYISALGTYSCINCVDTADTDDHLLTLITPYSEDNSINIIVTARRVRDNESAVTNADGATYNSSVKMSGAVTASLGKNATVEDYFNRFIGEKAAEQLFSSPVRTSDSVTLEKYSAVVTSARSYIAGLSDGFGGDDTADAVISRIVVNDTTDSAGKLNVGSGANKNVTVITVPSYSSSSKEEPHDEPTDKDGSSAQTETDQGGDSSHDAESDETSSAAEPSSAVSSAVSSKSPSSSQSSSQSSSNVLIYDPNFKTGITLYVLSSKGTKFKGDAVDIVAQIVEAEMGDLFSVEALKAQAVATFTYLVYHGGLKNTYEVSAPIKTASTIVKAATQAVIGQIIEYKGKPINAVYSAVSAGYSADAKVIWGSSIAYLKSVVSPYESDNKDYMRVYTLTAEKVASIIKSKWSVEITQIADKNTWFRMTYDTNNKYVATINFGGLTKNMRGNSVYKKFGLRSAAFTVKYNSSDDTFTFTCYGWGHGVGMSQVGANGYAKHGYNYIQILKHYYTGVEIVKYQ